MARSFAAAWAGWMIAAGLALTGCDKGQPQTNQAQPPNASTPVLGSSNSAQSIPLPSPPLDREALLIAAARAASAYASGSDDSEAQSELAGRQFTFRIRFGCSGPDSDPAQRAMSWTYDQPAERMKVRASPDISMDLPVAKALAAGRFEDVRGFWVPRSWLLTPSCPRGGSAEMPNSSPPSVGIAQFFTSSDSRASRRPGRALETVQRVAPDAVPGPDGLDLVLTGRLQPLGGGKVIHCSSTTPAERPVCILSVEFSSISIQDPRSGSSLAEWAIS